MLDIQIFTFAPPFISLKGYGREKRKTQLYIKTLNNIILRIQIPPPSGHLQLLTQFDLHFWLQAVF